MNWNSFPTIYLCNLQDVKLYLEGSVDNVDWDDSELAPIVEQASADFTGELQRLALPHNGTFKADWTKGYIDYSNRILNIYPYADLLAVSSVTNGNSETVNSSYYTIDDANSYPKSRLTIKWNSPVRWQGDSGGNYQQVITVQGIFGYVPHYEQAWKAKTTLGAAILDTSTTSVTVASSAGIYIGDYLQVDSETLLITVVPTTTTLTVERGALGTTAATHSNGVSVKLFQQKSDIRLAVREWAAYLWKTKDKIGEEVTYYEGVVRVPRGLSQSVIKTLLRNRKVQMDVLNGRFN